MSRCPRTPPQAASCSPAGARGRSMKDSFAVPAFFFQAEDGIRDVAVTGVQTCALPIFPRMPDGKPDFSGVYAFGGGGRGRGAGPAATDGVVRTPTLKPGAEKYRVVRGPTDRSEERRVGKEGRSGWVRCPSEKEMEDIRA